MLHGCCTPVGGGGTADGGGCCVADCTTESGCCCGAVICPGACNGCVLVTPFCIVAGKIEFGGGVSIEGADDEPFCKKATAADVSPMC